MKQIRVRWVDSRYQDGWIEQEDIEPKIAKISTLGYIVKETDEVLCIASSIHEASRQVSGTMCIPKVCIFSRKNV